MEIFAYALSTIVNTIFAVVGIVLAVVVLYFLIKFWIWVFEMMARIFG